MTIQQNFWHFLYNMIFWGLKLIRGFPSQKEFSARIPTTGHQNGLLQMWFSTFHRVDWWVEKCLAVRCPSPSISFSVQSGEKIKICIKTEEWWTSFGAGFDEVAESVAHCLKCMCVKWTVHSNAVSSCSILPSFKWKRMLKYLVQSSTKSIVLIYLKLVLSYGHGKCAESDSLIIAGEMQRNVQILINRSSNAWFRMCFICQLYILRPFQSDMLKIDMKFPIISKCNSTSNSMNACDGYARNFPLDAYQSPGFSVSFSEPIFGLKYKHVWER